MARLHGSFLLRWWVLDRGGSRIELEHIQSGARIVTRSLVEALAWIERGVEEQRDPAAAPVLEAQRPEEGGVSGVDGQDRPGR